LLACEAAALPLLPEAAEPVEPLAPLCFDCASAADNCDSRDWIFAFSSLISVVVDELEDDALAPPPPPPPPPAPLLEDAVDVVEPLADEDEDVPEDVLPEVALVVEAVLLLPEPDVVEFAAVDVVVPLVPSPAAANVEEVDCICMVSESSSKGLIGASGSPRQRAARSGTTQAPGARTSRKKSPLNTLVGLTASVFDFFRPLTPARQSVVECTRHAHRCIHPAPGGGDAP
jgi:hypothetical protein